MGSKFLESRRWESPVLTAPSAVLLTMLSTLVVIFAARRVLPLPAPGAPVFAVFAVVVFVAVALCTRKSRSNIDFGTVMFGVCIAVVFGVFELTRLSTESNAGGFAVQLRSLGAEDASAWTRIAGALYWQDAFPGWQGYPVVILLSLVSGALRPLQFLHGQEFGTIGYSTLVVGGAYSTLVMWIAVVCTIAYRRLAGIERRVQILIPVVIGLTLHQFVYQARGIGHLTGALAALALVTVLLAFSEADNHGSKITGTLPLAIALLGASLAWLPMAVVGLYAVLLATWFTLKACGSPTVRVSLIAGAGLIGWVMFGGLRGLAEELFTARGGTYQASSLILITTISLLVLLPAIGVDASRLRWPLLLVSAVLTILLGDSYFNASPNYGALKTVWVVTPVLFAYALIELGGSRVVRGSARFQRALALGLVLVMFAAGVPQSVTRAVASPALTEESELVADDVGRHWDTGYLKASRTLEDLPVACIVWDETLERFSPGWQGYLCSRYLGWSAPPTRCRGLQICQEKKNLDPEIYTAGLRFYGISGLSLSQVIVGWAEYGVDPSRTILVINKDGVVHDEVSVNAFVDKLVNG